MPVTPQDAYLESKILTATPLELVRLLYGAAGDAVRRAQEHLAAGRISERSRSICKALSILTELSSSLDHSRGGNVSRSLAELYDYMQRRLIEANLRQQPEPLVEVLSLLDTLLEGWQQIRTDEPSTSATWDRTSGWQSEYGAEGAEAGGYAGGGLLLLDAGREYAAQTWSL